MVDIPEFGDGDSSTVESVSERAKGLVPWLPDPYRCDNCDSLCKASVTWDPQMCDYMDSWECPECGSAYYREGY
jgi:hypothetical protein